MKIALEFRNGTYYVDDKSDHGGTLDQAMLFADKAEADAYFGWNRGWVWFHGGMLVGVELTRVALPEES